MNWLFSQLITCSTGKLFCRTQPELKECASALSALSSEQSNCVSALSARIWLKSRLEQMGVSDVPPHGKLINSYTSNLHQVAVLKRWQFF